MLNDELEEYTEKTFCFLKKGVDKFKKRAIIIIVDREVVSTFSSVGRAPDS